MGREGRKRGERAERGRKRGGGRNGGFGETAEHAGYSRTEYPWGLNRQGKKLPCCRPLYITEALRFRFSGERTGLKIKAGGTTRCEGKSRRMRSQRDPQRGRRKPGSNSRLPSGSGWAQVCTHCPARHAVRREGRVTGSPAQLT